MGGYGSGWHGPVKRTVESALKLRVSDIKPVNGHTGLLSGWQSDSLRTIVSYGCNGDVLRLSWVDVDSPDTVQKYVLMLDRQPRHYGGTQTYFCCPLCDRRCNVLYRPIKRKPFACRRCHDLTYESCQRSEISARVAAMIGLPLSDLRRLHKLMGI